MLFPTANVCASFPANDKLDLQTEQPALGSTPLGNGGPLSFVFERICGSLICKCGDGFEIDLFRFMPF